MLKKLFLFALLTFFVRANAQETTISPENQVALKIGADSLNTLFQNALDQDLEVNRVAMNYEFIPEMVKVLKTPQSFFYKFEEVKGMSIINAPDNSFRIFSWMIPLKDRKRSLKGISDEDYQKIKDLPGNTVMEEKSYKYYGAVQMNSGELKLYPLVDKSEEIKNPEDELLDNKNWYGCLVYNIIKNEHLGIPVYTYFGWDGNDGKSIKKIADVIRFDEDGGIKLGAPMFEVVRDTLVGVKNRFILEFKSDTGVSLNYKEDKKMIVYDYIKPPEDGEKGNYHLYIPDGTYEGFEFKNGMWKYVDKVFFETTSENDLARERAERENSKKKKKKKRKKRSKNKYGID